MERTQLRHIGELLDGDTFCEVGTHTILDLAKPGDWQAAAIVRPLRCDVRVFLGDMDRQKMCEGSDAFRADRSRTREQLDAGETEMSERFIAAKKTQLPLHQRPCLHRLLPTQW
jgi:hypothetical protein